MIVYHFFLFSAELLDLIVVTFVGKTVSHDEMNPKVTHSIHDKHQKFWELWIILTEVKKGFLSRLMTGDRLRCLYMKFTLGIHIYNNIEES